MRRMVCACAAFLCIANLCVAADEETADLRLRVKNNEALHYSWTITSTSGTSGLDQGKPFKLSDEFVLAMTLQLKGLPQKGDSTPVSIRLQNVTYSDKQSLGDDKVVVGASRAKIKKSINGKRVVDSENDIGSDEVNQYLDHVKLLESGEAHSLIDGAGRQTQVEGDSVLTEMSRYGGAQQIFPLLAGKSLKPGEAWEDTMSLPYFADFKLAKPAVVRSRMTFAKWETRDGKKLAQIDFASAMERTDLKGENAKGLLAEISHITNMTTGTCLFDPASGHFVEGNISTDVKYHIDGERDGQRAGFDMEGKTSIAFSLKDK